MGKRLKNVISMKKKARICIKTELNGFKKSYRENTVSRKLRKGHRICRINMKKFLHAFYGRQKSPHKPEGF